MTTSWYLKIKVDGFTKNYGCGVMFDLEAIPNYAVKGIQLSDPPKNRGFKTKYFLCATNDSLDRYSSERMFLG